MVLSRESKGLCWQQEDECRMHHISWCALKYARTVAPEEFRPVDYLPAYMPKISKGISSHARCTSMFGHPSPSSKPHPPLNFWQKSKAVWILACGNWNSKGHYLNLKTCESKKITFEEELHFNYCKIHPEILPLQLTQESGPHRIHRTAVWSHKESINYFWNITGEIIKGCSSFQLFQICI